MTAPRRDPNNKLAEQRAFDSLQQLSAVGEHGRGWIDRLFRPFFLAFRNSSRDWAKDANLALHEQSELRARALLYGIVLVFVLLLVWAALATIDEVTRGSGKVIPSRQLQVVQAFDGGVVEGVFVHEGQTVREGDLLVRIDPTRFQANFQEGQAKIMALQAKIERLSALAYDQPYAPNEHAEDEAQALLIAREQRYYQESLKELQEKLAVANEQLAQRRQEHEEALSRLRQAERSYAMSEREINVTRPLLDSGAVSEMDILRLERDLSNAEGERRQAAARSRQSAAGIQEAQARVREVEQTARRQWHAELSEATAQLNSLDKSVTGLADRVKFAEIRSPVNGTVQRIFFNTLGGVVQPGNAVAEIVPADDALLVEARIAPADIAFLRPGLPAVIKLHAYDFSIYGGLTATVQHISADTITDERDNTYYLVRAETDASGFAGGLPIIPGMTLQLDVLTGKRTVLSYLLKPILRAKANALSER